MVCRNSLRFVALMTCVALAAAPAAADWSRFRGPNGGGVAGAGELPAEIEAAAAAWATAVPFGRSSPAVGRDRVFLTAVEEGRLVTLAYDRATGEPAWRREAERRHEATLYHGTDAATASPATDGDNVYVLFHEAGLLSYDRDGNLRWRHPLGPFRNFYGIAASPVVAGRAVIVVADQARGSFVVAVDRDSGETLWRRDRAGRAESYATPLLLPSAAAPEVVLVLGSQWVDAYDLATGKIVWSLGGLGTGPVASPVVAAEMLIVSAPNHAPEPAPPFAELAAKHDADGSGDLTPPEVTETWIKNHFGYVDVDGDGVITARDWKELNAEMGNERWGVFGIRLGDGERPAEIVWNHRQNVPYIPTPLVYDGVLYTVHNGIVTALDPATGAVHKRGRLGAGAAKIYSSPVAGGGRVFVGSREGKLAILEPGPDWRVAAVVDLGAPIQATPAIAGGALFVRTDERLLRFGAPPAEKTEAAEPAPRRARRRPSSSSHPALAAGQR